MVVIALTLAIEIVQILYLDNVLLFESAPLPEALVYSNLCDRNDITTSA